MKTTLEFLDAVKAKHGFTSDYQLSKHLDCSRASISIYRAGKSFLDAEMACKIADDLGIEAGYILSCIAAERSKNPRVKKAWAWTAQHLGGLAASLLLLLILPTVALDSRYGITGLQEPHAPALYIMSNELLSLFYTYWYCFATLALLAFCAFPRYAPNPRK